LLPIFALIICGALDDADPLTPLLRRLRYLGDVAYHQYLLQHVVYWAMVNALGTWEAARFAYLPVLLATSAVSQHLFR
jgi:peptidoglycan/LPS O-acetylase OafA/YrhL